MCHTTEGVSVSGRGTFLRVLVFLDLDYEVSNSLSPEHLFINFVRLFEVGFTINLAKSEFDCTTIYYLGHLVGTGRTHAVQANVGAILSYLTPALRKSLIRLLGMVRFYRFCCNFDSIAAFLTDLTSPKWRFHWTLMYDAAFKPP
ncbi:uncharacterized protein LOC143034119 [Oratosquilla oratoria]|uniref:uncharacterized protein LOC143034119 n=1 Tax=Oratosquilla oratoria TaxID=337810 RepID=UPI003F778192